MQETINFEIGGQTYKLVGNNRELTELAAKLVNDKYNSITNVSQAANNREVALMLTALNLAEEKVFLTKEITNDEEVFSIEVEKMTNFVQNEIDKLLIS